MPTGRPGSPHRVKIHLHLRGSRDIAQGTVKWFNSDKGYGCIARDDGQSDVCVHYSEITGAGFASATSKRGSASSFEIGQGNKGPQATAVRAV